MNRPIIAALKTAYTRTMKLSVLDLNAPLEWLTMYISPTVTGFGTAADEKVQSRKDYRKMLMDARKQTKGLPYTARIKTAYTPKFKGETTAVFNDEIEIKLGKGKTQVVLHLWMSTVFVYQQNQWQLSLFHGSLPDLNSSSEDTWHIQEAEKKVKALEEKVAERTAEIVEKNRELQIEAALERVRAIAMGMKKAEDMLLICKTISQQLAGLGVQEIRNVQTAIFYRDKGTYMNYEYYSKHQKTIITEVVFRGKDVHRDQKKFAKSMLAGRDSLYIEQFSGTRLKQWYLYQKGTNQLADRYLLNAHSLNYYWFSLGEIALGISTYYPLTATEQILFQRFRNVFDLSYRRYLDIEKAAAQAREAQIEAALEKVRSRSLAMQEPEELREVAELLRKEMALLGVEELETSSIYLVHKEKKQATCWYAIKDVRTKNTKTVSDEMILGLTETRVGKEMWKFYISKKEQAAVIMKGAQRKEWINYCADKSKVLNGYFGDDIPDRTYHLIKFSGGYIGAATQGTISDESRDLLKRATAVFSFAYTRFKDLQDARERAREAQIENSLERVRSKAMAMHNSNDILTTATTAFEELSTIGIHSIRSGVGMFSNESDFAKVYAATKLQNGKIQTIQAERNTNEHDSLRRQRKSWQEQKDLEEKLNGKELVSYYNNKFFKESSVTQSEHTKNRTEFGYYFAFKDGLFYSWAEKEYTQEEKKILDRFRSIIALTFRRFLDLQKAEEQAREAQIEAALERVRSRSLAMHKSDELGEVVIILLQKLNELGINPDAININIIDKTSRSIATWFAAPDIAKALCFSIQYIDHPVINDAWDAFYAKKDGYQITYSKKIKDSYFKYLYTHTPFKQTPEDRKKMIMAAKIYHLSVALSNDAAISVHNYTDKKLTEKEYEIVKRFSNVFQQSYTRFLDLQKAEEQAREAQIEVALERVRSKAMAMHNSSDLPATAIIAFSELKKLGFIPIRGGISIQNKENRKNLLYSATTSEQGDNLSIVGWAILDHHPVLRETYDRWLRGEDYYPELHGDLLKSYYEQVSATFSVPTEQTEIDQYGYFMHFTHGLFYGWCNQPVTDEEKKLLKRFASVIDLTFKRYFDLQKAEEQAREAQIEAALEKVRSVAMSMHHSNELLNICEAIYGELIKLGMVELRNTMINIHNDGEETFLNYDYSAYAGRAVTKYGYNIHPIINHLVMQSRSAQDAFIDVAFEGAEFEAWRSFRKASGEKDDARLNKITHLHYYFYSIGIGSIGISTFESINEQNLALLKRFRNVFQLAYQRFTDLTAAEAQAREAQIETALERVRSRTMAMQNSNELAATVQVMFEECRKLQPTAAEENFSRGFITTIDQKKKIFDLWITEVDGTRIDTRFNIGFDEPTTGVHILKAWKQKKPFLVSDLKGEILDQWLDYLAATGFKVAPGIRGTRRVNTFIYYSNGFIGITSSLPLAEESIQILQRFAKVFDQTYTRFLDLQKAEAATKEAVKQAALDRIRADIASMRTIEDLNRITPLIWNELTTLGIPFIRCGVFIMDEMEQQIHTFLSTPDGQSIAAFHLSFTESKNIIAVVEHWRNKKVYSNHWGEKEFGELADSLVKQQAIKSKEAYLQSLPRTGVALNFVPYLQGMLYVGNTEPLLPEDIGVLQAVADAFSTAYARYEDFNKLEAAKQVVEKTLEELKVTQKQLVQSEKMASLGELTAGIAHEIQNPLNFVNNFSEVSRELIDELKQERGKEEGVRDKVLEEELLSDIDANLEKINHHGKRASDIVKGMLQHSRTSTGQKEPTDINALCDEYLRLAYHGLRAKDKTFNAQFETHFDENLSKVNVVPQDMGRVVLNIINNAFFAVAKQSEIFNRESEKYEPRVIVRTKLSPRDGELVSQSESQKKIIIEIEDNGGGIPADIKEKIFQPFFTTKPTGQGTGLGLSLAYDIVKAHGGEIRVETPNEVGTIFCILLPQKNNL